MEKIFLSKNAKNKLSNCSFGVFTLVGVAFFLGAILVAILLEKAETIFNILFFSILLLANVIIMVTYWNRNKKKIFAENAEDYNMAIRVKELLDEYSSRSVAEYPVLEKEITGDWRPFRVEHFLSNSLRGEITGWGGWWKMFHGSFKGISTPNLLEDSSVLFLTDGEKTLRVLIPSPSASRALLTSLVEKFTRPLHWGTHLYKVFEDFSMKDNLVISPLSHPAMIDSLDVSCQKPLLERPFVKVMGTPIQEGLAMGTALEVGGVQKVFMPSGFFACLTAGVIQLLGTKVETRSLDAITV